MPTPEPVPEPDAAEQRELVDGNAAAVDRHTHGDAEVPDADAQEQAQAVEVDQMLEPAPRGDDVPEADWLEQSMAEPLDDDRR